MEKFLKILDFDLKIEEKSLLSHFSLHLEESTCILGESGSGKSLLLRKLSKDSSLYSTNGKVSFYLGDTKPVTNWKNFLSYSSLPLSYQRFCDAFFQNKKQIDLKCALLYSLLEEPDYFFVDDIPLSNSDFSLLVSFLKAQNICFFFVTSDVEKVVFFDYLYVLKNNQIAMEGKTLLVLKEEKLMKVLGFSLPFYVNLSIQLGYYGLLSDLYFSKEELEVALWQSK